MRRITFLAFAFVVAPSCVTVTWRDRALAERADLSTPELAFETFRAAIRCDDARAGYGVISEEMKAREHFTFAQFSIGWQAFFEAHPFARLAGNAELLPIAALHAIAPAHADAVLVADNEAQVTTLAVAHGHHFLFVLVRESFFEVRLHSGRTIDASIARVGDLLAKDPNDPKALVARVTARELATIPTADIREVRVASEWKLTAFREVPPN